MCWIGKKTDKKIAENDIVTYKVMYHNKGNDTFNAYYYFNFQYNKGDEYTLFNLSEHGSVGYNEIKIYEGFHSYSFEKTEINWLFYCRNICTIFNRHTLKTIDCYGEVKPPNSLYNMVFVKCIIPKGSCFYENERGEIVSNAIIITGETFNVKHC